MNVLRKALCMTALVLLGTSAQAQTSPYSKYAGIWRDFFKPNKYYSLQVNGSEMIFIDLSGLETSGNTLFSSYYGGVVPSVGPSLEARFTVFAERQLLPASLWIFFESDKDLWANWSCGVGTEGCLHALQHLIKVF
jgi:hypothetical protein